MRKVIKKRFFLTAVAFKSSILRIVLRKGSKEKGVQTLKFEAFMMIAHRVDIEYWNNLKLPFPDFSKGLPCICGRVLVLPNERLPRVGASRSQGKSPLCTPSHGRGGT
jgi:hypothetical protein